jgi:hypothetical protein
MPYQLKFYAYLGCWLAVGFVAGQLLSEYGFAFVLFFAATLPAVAIYFGRWLFGRKNL